MDGTDLTYLAVAILALAILAGCYWLMTEIHRGGQLETCLARRQKNCEQFAR